MRTRPRKRSFRFNNDSCQLVYYSIPKKLNLIPTNKSKEKKNFKMKSLRAVKNSKGSKIYT